VSPLSSVRGKLALALLLVVAGVLAIVYVIVVPSYRTSLENTELDGLQSSLQNVALPRYPPESYLQQQFVDSVSQTTNDRVVVFTLTSETPTLIEAFADSATERDSTELQNDPVALAAVQHRRAARGTVRRDGQSYAEVAYPVGDAAIMLSAPLHDQLQAVALVRRRVFVAGGLAMAFAVLFGYAGASLITRRIRRLETAAERIAEGRFDQPVVDHGSDEVGQLARTFERMRLRLADLERARGEFIANASHELRTPLFSLAGFLELLDDPDLDEGTRDEFVGQMREQVARLTRLATNLLDLSRLDAGRLTVAREPLDLSELAQELVAEFGPRAAAAGQRLEAPPEPGVSARGDGGRVLQIGRVLVENALVHTPPGTTVRVTTAVEGGRATLTVANDGPAIPEEAHERIFERFYRLDGGRASGSGLGLAIARELAEVMGGRIEIESPDGWTLFTLVLSADVPEREPAPDLV
jgi:two-component system, OmpR family, sensor kinase